MIAYYSICVLIRKYYIVYRFFNYINVFFLRRIKLM